ncbi:MAG: glycosyltransferase [Clostridia bacterium]|nr:glycosyltransferase [Clostridia bacterium]
MNVVHICRNLAGSTVFPQLFEALAEKGLKQRVFVPEKTDNNRGKNVPRNVPTEYAVTLRTSDTLFFHLKAARTVPWIQSCMGPEETDLIHAHTLFTDGSIARELGRKWNRPFVVTLRYSDVAVIWKYEWHLRPMARTILREAAGVICLSPVVREQVIRFLPESEQASLADKCRVIPNGLDPAWLEGARARTMPTGPVRVGFAGGMNRRKRPMDALAAVHLADAGEGRFVFTGCGAGKLEPQVRGKLHPGDSLKGRIEGRADMSAFYESCDVLLVPSSAETFGMVYLEAMSRGVPVLYTRGQGFDGQFPEGEVGFSVGCGNRREQAARLRQILEGYEERSRRCIRHAGEYVWPRITDRFMAAYLSALE